MELDRIRNFSIIAHIDHGKTTLSDRILEATHAVSEREMVAQFLDGMDLERERGITIKAHAVSLRYQALDGHEYQLNLIDTPGHVDFNYEVSRALAACEGALLVVDATQGVEAQTLANAYLAVDQGLEIVPVINKIDLPSAQPERVAQEIEEVVGLDATEAILTSAKERIGIQEVLEAVVNRLPPPKGLREAPLKAMVFDSWYDAYRGVIMLVRVIDGRIGVKDRVRFMNLGTDHDVEALGIFTPKPLAVPLLEAGEVGFVIAGIKEVQEVRVGDTLTSPTNPTQEAFGGFRKVKPMVFAGLYPVDPSDYPNLREALDKLRLNDSSFVFEPETSEALGFGFRCGFLGFLHMEIIQERLEREFNLDLITTAPNVRYQVLNRKQEVVDIENPSQLPSPVETEEIREPYASVTVLTRSEYVGNLLRLFEERRGTQSAFQYASQDTVLLKYDMPLSEIIVDFYDRLKALSRGYASMDYQVEGYKPGDLVKLDIIVNGKPVDALSFIVHRDQAESRGRAIAQKLKESIPRQLFEVVVQAALGSRIVCRTVVKPLRKNVLAKCYGGDITRKRKLLEKQKEGKKRMKQVGEVQIPQEAFLSVLRVQAGGDEK
ncbi:MAG: translation elongation factor 4 [Acidobacteriota bacterium]